MSQVKKSQQGFSLLELLVSLFILSFGMLGFAALQVTVIRHNANAKVRTAAASIASGIIEEVTALDEHNPVFDSDANNMVWDFGGNSTLALPGGGAYSAFWSVATDDPIDGVAKITVVVSSTNGVSATATNYKRFL